MEIHPDPVISNLLTANPLREPVLRRAVETLQLPPASRGVDAGCGIGLQELLLAEAIGPGGHVTGVDINPAFLAYGERLVTGAGLSGQVTFRQGSLEALPLADGSVDWLWSADCAGYPHGDLPALLKEFSRVVKPGGRIILLAWTSQQVLPGYPLLEARLNAACSGYAPYLAGKDPEGHFLRAPRWFREAGLVEFEHRTLAGEVCAPLTDEQHAALSALISMLWDEQALEAGPPEDWREYRRLCKPGSPDFILDHPGYYAFFTYTIFSGVVAGK